MPRLVVGITGASGAIYGVRLLERLHELPVETHVVVTRWARVTIEHETPYTYSQVKELADAFYGENDQAAAISSGSFPHARNGDRSLQHEDAAPRSRPGSRTTWSAARPTSRSRSGVRWCSRSGRRR